MRSRGRDELDLSTSNLVNEDGRGSRIFKVGQVTQREMEGCWD